MDAGSSKSVSATETTPVHSVDTIPVSILRMMALLSTGPMSGYDMKNMISSEEFSGWKDSFGNIYPNLRKMVQMGLVEKQRDDFKGRKRIFYSLTDQGKQLLDQWLVLPCQRLPVRMELLFKLRFATHLGVDVTLDHLREYLGFSRSTHPMYEKWRSDVENDPENSLEYEINRLTSDFWYRFTKTLLEWSTDSVQRMEEYRKKNSPKGGGSCQDHVTSRYFSPSV